MWILYLIGIYVNGSTCVPRLKIESALTIQQMVIIFDSVFDLPLKYAIHMSGIEYIYI